MQYLSLDNKTKELFALFGVNSKEEALTFIDAQTQTLVEVSDEEYDALKNDNKINFGE